MAEFENIGAQLPSNPGSYNDFLERTGMEPGMDAIRAMSEEVQQFKQDLVLVRGLKDTEELRRMPLTFSRPELAIPVGHLALSKQAG